jgi:hypothetical protein
MVNRIEAFRNGDFERRLRSVPPRGEDSADGILTGPSGAEAIGMG